MKSVSKYLFQFKPQNLASNRFGKMRIVVFFILIIVGYSSCAANEVKGKVVGVLDGNTVQIISEAKDEYKVVLAGIDCPELAQQYGVEAKKYLEKLILKKSVRLILKGKDRFGNYVGVLLLNGDDDPRIEMLKEGLAWTDEKKPQPELEPYRSWAEKKKKGLWQEENPTPPWTYRRQQSMVNPKSR